MARLYEPGDEILINEGYNEVFGTSRDLAEWAWKFPPSEHGRAIMWTERDGRAQAQFACIPVRYRIDGEVHWMLSAVDIFARKTARTGLARRGDLQHTADAFFEHFGADGRHTSLIGFPSRRHRRLGRLQFGYEALAPAPLTMLRRATGRRPGGARRRLYRAELAPDWEPRLTTLWLAASRDYPVAAERDADFALHRFAGHPTVTYHRFLIFPRFSEVPVAWVVFRVDQGCCWWVDLLWDHDHPGALELASALSTRLCRQTGIDEESMWFAGDAEGSRVLERHGFEMRPEPNDLCLVARPLDPAFNPGVLADRTYITMADADLI